YVAPYVGLGPWSFPVASPVFTAMNRQWETLLGYDGDHVTYFQKDELLHYIPGDNVVYIISHAAAAGMVTAIFDSSGDMIIDWDISQAIKNAAAAGQANPHGFMFVQVNACNSGTARDQNQNHDIAKAFGILTFPLDNQGRAFTRGRAYLGWQPSHLLPINE